MVDRIWNGTVVRERWPEHPMTGVVISQINDRPEYVVVRWEGGAKGEWEERVTDLVVVSDEKPVQDGTRAYSR